MFLVPKQIFFTTLAFSDFEDLAFFETAYDQIWPFKFFGPDK